MSTADTLRQAHEVIAENHQWHQDYDSNAYDESHLEEVNRKALRLLEDEIVDAPLSYAAGLLDGALLAAAIAVGYQLARWVWS